MSWTPQDQVFDLTPLVDNLLAYIDINDEEALAWASGANRDDYPGFAGLYPNAAGRLATKFPQLLVLDQELSVPESLNRGDLLIGLWSLTIEGAVTGKSADATVLLTKTYAKAAESMLVNIALQRADDGTLLIADGASPDITNIVCLGYQTAYDQLRGQGGKPASSWLQIWQTRVEYQLEANSL